MYVLHTLLFTCNLYVQGLKTLRMCSERKYEMIRAKKNLTVYKAM